MSNRAVRYTLAASLAAAGASILVPAVAQTKCRPGYVFSKRLNRCVKKPVTRKAPKRQRAPVCPSGYSLGAIDLKGGDFAAGNKQHANQSNGYGGKCVQHGPARCCDVYESGGNAASCSSAVVAIQPGTSHQAQYKPPDQAEGYSGPIDETWYCACKAPYVKVWGITTSAQKLEAFSCLPKKSWYQKTDMPGVKTRAFYSSN